jgi:methionine-gamma-lyase
MPVTPSKHSKRTHIGDHLLHPETQMMNYGYDPALSEGSVKPPVFLTSTFVFRTAEEGRDFFNVISGHQELPPGESAGLVYSRFKATLSDAVCRSAAACPRRAAGTETGQLYAADLITPKR